MAYLITKSVGPFKYFARFGRNKYGDLAITYEGLKQNGTPFTDRSLAEDHLYTAEAERKTGDSSFMMGELI